MNIKSIVISLLFVFACYSYASEKSISENKSYGVAPLRTTASFAIPFISSSVGFVIGEAIGKSYADSCGYSLQTHNSPEYMKQRFFGFIGAAAGSSLGSLIGILINNKIPPRNYYGKKWSQRIGGGFWPTITLLGTAIFGLKIQG